MKGPPPPSKEAMYRYLVVSKVYARCLQGVSQTKAIEEVAGEAHLAVDGRWRRISPRTLYRWYKMFGEAKASDINVLAGLERKARAKIESSVVLDAEFIAFAAAEKHADPGASVPELIARARELGLIDPGEKVCRSTVNRALTRMGVSLARSKSTIPRDCRRYSFAHRMECVLCDGKHFRAGVNRAKRVALFFLDDATRFALHVVVGSSENKELFLRGLYEMVRRYGFMSVLYLDHGAAFIAGETVVVSEKLGAALIHGEKAYPEGHGKIEAFNKTAKAKVLRGYEGRVDLSTDFDSLELRLRHYLQEIYNHTPHESLGLKTPAECFSSDERSLRLPRDDAALRDCFTVSIPRVVSKDHVASWKGTGYELPTGYARQSVALIHQLLDKKLLFLHDGRYIELHPVDPIANAHTRRGRRESPQEETQPSPQKSAADMAYDRSFRPLTDSDGGFSDK